MLVGENIILRPIEREDLDFFNIWRNNMDIKNQALLHPFPVTKELDEDWFNNTANDKSNRTVFFTILDKNKKVLGYTFLNAINWINRNCYFGIIVGDNSQRGKGIGKEALGLVTEYAFANLNLRKIKLEVASYNKAAINLYSKFNFEVEGTLKNEVFIDNQYFDVQIMSKFKK